MPNIFRYWKLNYASRLVLSALLYSIAIIIILISTSIIPGLPFIVGAWFVLALKAASNKPKDLGLEEWRAVGEGEVNRIADSLIQSKKIRTSGNAGTVFKILFVIIIYITGFGLNISKSLAGPVLLSFGMLAIPGLFFGKTKIHLPYDLSMKMPSIQTIMGIAVPKNFTITPYLRFDKDEENRDIPEDIRLMLESKKNIEDLIGVQFQISINNGARGPVPYMYAVAITKGQAGRSYKFLSKQRSKYYIVEAGGDNNYGTVVFRQDTSGTGYHTTEHDCIQLFNLVIKYLQAIEI